MLKYNSYLILLLFILCLNKLSASGHEATYKIRQNGFYLYNSSRFEESVEYYRKYLNVYPNDEIMMLYLAYSYVNLYDYENAERVYHKILKINPENKNAQSGLYLLYEYHINNAILRQNYNLAFDYVKKGQYFLSKNSKFHEFDALLNEKINNNYRAYNKWLDSWQMDYDRTNRIINTYKLHRAARASLNNNKEHMEEFSDLITKLSNHHKDNRELLKILADVYFYLDKSLNKRIALRNKAMDLYQKEYPTHTNPIEIDFPLNNTWLIVSGYFQYGMDTHNGYDGYCLDFINVTENGERIVNGTGLQNEDYQSFGKNIYAVADGVVNLSVDIYADNKVTEKVDISALYNGNIIILEHNINGRKYYSHYVHLMQDSSTVITGQIVKQGEIIGKVGNSGYSTGPHLHFGLYDKNRVSVPVNFLNITTKTPLGTLITSKDYKYGNIITKNNDQIDNKIAEKP